MTKGTPSMGLRNKHSHIICRRCGKMSFHARKGVCSSCGFGKSAKLRKYTWTTKARDN